MLKRQLKEYFKGKRKEFSLQMLTPGTEFQRSVWKELRKIPYGSTMSYQEQADLLKNPLSVRAVAQANGANRLAIIIPCHRVIGSDGHLVGYGGGLERKKWLLDHEKKFSGKPVDLNLF
jgi:AraC family transcriptional regulator of adaptative response/methylated-DNA-[protein]-cysteine methyltransferase